MGTRRTVSLDGDHTANGRCDWVALPFAVFWSAGPAVVLNTAISHESSNVVLTTKPGRHVLTGGERVREVILGARVGAKRRQI